MSMYIRFFIEHGRDYKARGVNMKELFLYIKALAFKPILLIIEKTEGEVCSQIR